MKISDSIDKPCVIMTRFDFHQVYFLKSLFRLSTQGCRIAMLERIQLVIAWLHNPLNDVRSKMNLFQRHFYNMKIISRDEACGIFYCKKFNDNNAEECTRRVDAMEEADVCFTNNISEPLIICDARIYGSPSVYKRYQSATEIEEQEKEADQGGEERPAVVLNNEQQIIQFINEVYRPRVEYEEDSLYKLKYVYDHEILSNVWKYNTKFDKTVAAFTKWLNRQDVDFVLEGPVRKVKKKDESTTEKKHQRFVNVLDDRYQWNVAHSIVGALPQHHAYMASLKEEGYHVIGCCRKSDIKSDNLVSLLNKMVDILYNRSLVDDVFVSPFSNVKQPFEKRDLKVDRSVLFKLDRIQGTTQDMLKSLTNMKKCVWLESTMQASQPTCLT